MLAFIPDPAPIVHGMAHALKPGGAALFHEYYDYASWRLAPHSALLEDYVARIIARWRATGSEPDIALQLPTLLAEAGFTVEATRPVIFAAAMRDFAARWPMGFAREYLPSMLENGDVTAGEAHAIAGTLSEYEANPARTRHHARRAANPRPETLNRNNTMALAYSGREGLSRRPAHMMKMTLLAAAAVIALSSGAAFAQSGPDPDGYYSRTDRDGYYDREGHYQHFNDSNRPDVDDRDGSPPPPAYYREGDYERDCHRGTAAGTVFGAVGGGLIGGAASHGNAGAVVGGVLLGGLLGNALSRDVDCDDQRYAFDSYAVGLNGDIGERHEWRHGESYGYFTPTREYTEDGRRCREFTTVTYRHGEENRHDGSACYGNDGYWHFN